MPLCGANVFILHILHHLTEYMSRHISKYVLVFDFGAKGAAPGKTDPALSAPAFGAAHSAATWPEPDHAGHS